jgi:hypothetical protein
MRNHHHHNQGISICIHNAIYMQPSPTFFAATRPSSKQLFTRASNRLTVVLSAVLKLDAPGNYTVRIHAGLTAAGNSNDFTMKLGSTVIGSDKMSRVAIPGLEKSTQVGYRTHTYKTSASGGWVCSRASQCDIGP